MDISQFAAQLSLADSALPGKIILQRPITEITLDEADYKAAKIIKFLLPGILSSGADLASVLALLSDLSWWLNSTAVTRSRGVPDDQIMAQLVMVHGAPTYLVGKTLMFIKQEVVTNMTKLGDLHMLLNRVSFWFTIYYSKTNGDI